jgi:hypothetical protein
MCEDFAPKYGDKITDCCFTLMHCLTLPFSPENFFTKNNLSVVPHPPIPLSSVSPIEDKIEKPTIEVIEAELQAVLNTLTEHDFQDAFTKW